MSLYNAAVRIAYFDCASGCAGDMCLGALVDAGCDPARLAGMLAGLGIGREFDLSFERVKRGPLAATKARVFVIGKADEHPHRRLADVLRLIDGARLPGRVAERAASAFRALAAAEAKVHGESVESVHFHEVGAVDAIVDVVGTCAALEVLGVEEVHSSEATVGRGTIRSAHGELPAPGPAVMNLLAGKPLRTRDVGHELTTPTGAALLATLAGPRFGSIPAMTLLAQGWGAGDADFKTHPNVLRVLLGETAPAAGAGAEPKGAPERCVVLEANLDDLTPQLVSAAIDALLAAGALDAFTVPCLMKKGRPGHLLAALAREGDVARIEAVFFRETTTFGVRRRAAERTVLAREIVRVATEFGEVEVKVGRLDGLGVVTAAPEYESARRLAEAKGVAVRAVIDAARAAAREIR
jgi:uncharacterized protein (TIGR00299 family) protein